MHGRQFLIVASLALSICGCSQDANGGTENLQKKQVISKVTDPNGVTTKLKSPTDDSAQIKSLVVCFDGTGNDDTFENGKDGPTNVFLLFDKYAGTENQKVLYVQGVGTTGKGVKDVVPKALGVGMTRRVSAGYDFLKEHATKDAKVFIFGFSRGAAQARMLANKLHDQPIDGSDRIAMLGIWDTVSAIGLPKSDKADTTLYKLGIPSSVEMCCHAIAIDEKRQNFNVTLAKVSEKTRLEEVWFCGDHSDVGGGWFVGPNSRFLANSSLRWMLSRAVAAGLTPNPAELTGLRESTTVPKEEERAKEKNYWDAKIHNRAQPDSQATIKEEKVANVKTGGSEDRKINGKLHVSVVERVLFSAQYRPKNVLNDINLVGVKTVGEVKEILGGTFEIVERQPLP